MYDLLLTETETRLSISK